jgi:hypothetical protein
MTFYAGLKTEGSSAREASAAANMVIVETPLITAVVDASLLTDNASQAWLLLLKAESAVLNLKELLAPIISAALLRAIAGQRKTTALIQETACSSTGDVILTPRLLGLRLRMYPDL